MRRLFACLLLVFGLLVGLASPVDAQRGRGRGRGHGPHRMGPPPRAYRRAYRAPAYQPRYYHAAPYRSYGGRSYYRPRAGYYRQPGPGVIIRPRR